MTIRVSPTEKNPTHHISLTDRNGKKVGLVMCDAQGRVSPKFKIIPVERTALKTTSGNSGYDSMDYPYFPIVQDDWSGGRGGLDFERDNTKFSDSFRMRTSRANKAYNGPQEQFTKGYRSQDYAVPGNVKFHALTNTARSVAKRFTASANYTAGLAWLEMRRKGTPKDLLIAIYSDNAGAINAELSHIHVASTRLTDVLSEWLDETISQALANGVAYWLVVQGDAADTNDNHWEVGVKTGTVSTYVGTTIAGADWAAADFDLYFRLTDADDATKTCKYFEYRGLQYKIISGATGAPKLYKNGDRGAADSNAGQLTKLIDATKAWQVNEHAGKVAMLIGGPGSNEKKPYRTITSNDATSLTFAETWLIEHTTATEYVIVGSDTWTEITGHGLTVPVTDLLISTQNVLYVLQGDAINARALRCFNNAGTFADFSDAVNCQADAGFKATFITYKPQANKIVIAKNTDASYTRVVTCETSSNVSGSTPIIPAWGTALTWAAAVQVGELVNPITGLEVYPDESGNEAVKVFKTDIPWVLPTTGQPYPVNLNEMKVMRAAQNGEAHLVHNVYEYFNLGNGVTRYYGGTFEDVGPNLGEGLPAERQGPVISMIGYPGKWFALIDAGATGYSTLMMRDGNGWHEHYRAPKGQRITAIAFQPVPGQCSRLWLYQGNDSIWLPFPSADGNELTDSNYRFTHESALVISRMHAGMFDVQKMVKIIKLQTDNLEKDVCWIEMDYRLGNDSAWITIEESFVTSPTQEIDLTAQYGIATKRLQLRVRGYTADATQTPILLGIIVEAVMRVSVKNIYPVTFRALNHEPSLETGSREPDEFTAKQKKAMLDLWQGDESDSMLMMNAVDEFWDERMVFLNPVTWERVTVKPMEGERFEDYVCWVGTSSLQEA